MAALAMPANGKVELQLVPEITAALPGRELEIKFNAPSRRL
jgi:hypothetical protein